MLGSDAIAACNYSFPVTDIASFIELSKAFEAVGTSAYAGAAHFLTDPDVVTAAASILATEARQSSFVVYDILDQAPFSSSFETPLDMNQAYTLASPYIVSCPATNPSLPLKAFPALNVSSNAHPGAEATFQFNATDDSPAYVAIFNGLNTTFTPLTISSSADNSTTGTAIIPDFLQGLVYAIITSDNTSVADSATVAGPVLLDLKYSANASNFRI